MLVRSKKINAHKHYDCENDGNRDESAGRGRPAGNQAMDRGYPEPPIADMPQDDIPF
ncbi:MAG: hypothetical protein HZB24_14630 [Desulfobacterales bacterium]|nr:hypothetical protein [Desulfobacterales bacterium]